MSTEREAAKERGHAAIELVASVGLLLLPVVLLVASIPTWSERTHTAIAVAREATIVAASGFPGDATAEAESAARSLAAAHGVPEEDIRVEVHTSDAGSGHVSAEVTVRMPALAIPAMGNVGSWSWSTTHTRRIGDYRSRG
ncbi:MAG: YdcF family protein [Acidimicrobiia bacterium]|nr:YdcF family protein [Acidimicrobiia bacterium]